MRSPVAIPVGMPPIPGPPLIIARPVRGQHEGDDRHVDLVDIVGEIDVMIAVEIFEISRRHPATVIREAHVAPGFAAQQPWISTRAPSGMRSTSGKPEPGPARRPVETVTIPGAASAAVGASSNAANNTLRNFMA